MAEGVFKHLVSNRDDKDEWLIDSAGTSDWHAGEEPDERTRTILAKNIQEPFHHIGRKITKDDYNKFHYIFGFNEDNMENLKRRQPSGNKAVVKYLGEYDPEGQLIIEDPYYGDLSDFQRVYDQCTRCLKAFLEKEFK